MSRRHRTQPEMEAMLAALERLAREAVEWAARAQRDVARHRFETYLDFRTRFEEFGALVAVLHNRLEGASDDRSQALHEEIRRLDALMLTLVARVLRRLLAELADGRPLPIGTRDIFVPDRQLLETLRGKLAHPDYVPRLSPEVSEDLEVAAQLLEDVIARAPGLPSFDDVGRLRQR